MFPRRGSRQGSTVWFKFLSPLAACPSRSVASSQHKRPEERSYMKKTLTFVVLIVTPTLAFAQGLVQFNNLQGTGPVRQWTSGSDSNLVSVPKTTGTTVNGRVEILTYYRSEEHTSELQSLTNLVCRLLLEKK